MKNLILLIVLCVVSLSQAATKIPGTMLGTGAVASQGASGKVDVQSVYFGGGADCSAVCSTGNCTICTQTGGKISSVSWFAAGAYNINGIDGTKYICTGSGYITKGIGLIFSKTNSAPTYARIFSNETGSNANSAINSVICVGIP